MLQKNKAAQLFNLIRALGGRLTETEGTQVEQNETSEKNFMKKILISSIFSNFCGMKKRTKHLQQDGSVAHLRNDDSASWN